MLFGFGDVSVQVYSKSPVLPFLPGTGILLSVPIPSLVHVSMLHKFNSIMLPGEPIPTECTVISRP